MKFKNVLKLSRKNKRPLPLNPFLLEKLGCDQSYELTSTGYRCNCLRGYIFDSETSKCKKYGSYIAYCQKNEILSLDEFNQAVCVCKPGYGGNGCEHNICHWSDFRSPEERDYIHGSIKQFCNVPSCRLAFDQFKCYCDEKFSKQTKDGKCELIENCSEDQNNGKCGRDKLCKIITNDNERTFVCQCPIDMQDSNSANCKSITKKQYCLQGYLPNLKMNKVYRQKCIKGNSALNFTFQMRFDLSSDNNSKILLKDYYELENEIDLDRMPSNLINNFVNYKDNALIYSMGRVINKDIIKSKMNEILEDAFDKQMFRSHFHRECYMIPSVEFDYESISFSLLRIQETLVDVHLQVTCKTHTTGELFSSFFKFFLKHNVFNSNYQSFHAGHVIPESIKYVDVK